MPRIARLVVPASADNGPSRSAGTRAPCKRQRFAGGTTAIRWLSGGSASAYGRCVSKLTKAGR